MEVLLTLRNFYKHPRFWRHVAAWSVFLIFVLALIAVDIFYSEDELEFSQVVKVNLFFVELAILIYASFYFYNRLQPKRKYLQLFISILTVIIILAAIDDYMDTSATQIGALKGFFANVIIFPVLLLIAFGVKLSYHGARQLFIIQQLESKQTESELKLLKSQINPHFLFNTLNNIYSTNLDNHEKANEIILELADLLRYQLESNRKNKALLKDEVESLKNYIQLEKIRVRDCTIKLAEDGSFGEVEIVPLLLLPFVENAFKYGTGIEAGEIELRFDLSESQLFSFYCKNKIVQKKGKVHSGGIGLDNVKKRLDLMYKNKYELKIDHENDYFVVDLKIQL